MTFPTIALVGLALLQTPTAPQDAGVLLRRTLKEGEVDTYKVDVAYKQKIIVEQIGSQDFTIVGNLLYAEKVGKLDPEKKTTGLDVTVSQMKFELGGFAEGLQSQIDQLPKEIKMQGAVDERNRITALKPAVAEQAQFAGFIDLLGGAWKKFTELPEQSVKVGDVWDLKVPKDPAYGDVEFTLKAKLVGEKTVGEVAVWVINVEGVLPMNMPLESLMGPDGGVQDARLVGPLDFKMEWLIEKATGRLIESNASAKGTQQLQIPTMGVTAEVKGESTAKMKLVSPKPAEKAVDPPNGAGG